MSFSPRNWTKAPIGSLCNLRNGRAFKPSEWQITGIPIVRIQNLNNTRAGFNYFNGNFEKKHVLKNGDLLFAWSGTPGTSFGAHIWHGGEALLNQHIFRVDFDEALLERRFFRYAINQKLTELIGVAHGGAGLQHVTKGVFEKTEVDIPPREEQRRIAEKLDKVLARVDAIDTRLARVTLILRRLRQAVLADATSGRLTAGWREARTELWPWTSTTFGSVATDLRYGTSKKCHSEVQGTAVLRIPNVGNNGYPDCSDLKYAEFYSAERRKLSLAIGDILIIRSNGSIDLVGKSCVVDKKAAGLLFAGYLMRLRVDIGKVVPRFAHFSLMAPDQRRRIEATAKSTSGVNNINSEELRSLPIELPSVEEQVEIVRRVETLFAFADRLEARLQVVQAAADRLTPALLAKAFRGELVPQDPNDEPADELLKRLRASSSSATKLTRKRRTA